MNYNEAKQYLKEVNKYGSVLGLKSITTLLKEMGNPEKSLKVVHIAGTNGKGSTMAFLNSILMEAGYKVGRYSSPAVFEEDEIIQINNQNIEPNSLGEIITHIKEKCDYIAKTYGFHPTPFEIETALAFEYFKRKNCDIVLVECGMGGATDATNVFHKVLCSIIANISLDHTAFLGDTIEEIAMVKSGIIKANCPVVVAKQQKEICDVIREEAEKKNSHIVMAKEAQLDLGNGENIVTYRASNGKEYKANLKMLGTYQGKNVATAIEVALILEKKGYNTEKYIKNGIENAVWKGRFEIISKQPLFVIDGAHNPGAIEELVKCIDLYFTNKRITFIMGVLADKDFEKEAGLIANKGENILTVTPNNARALDGKKLANTISKYNQNVQYVESIDQAVEKAIDLVNSKKSDMILAFGSLSHLNDINQAVKAGRRD